FRVLAEIAVRTSLSDRLDDGRALDAPEAYELLAKRGMAGGGHRDLLHEGVLSRGTPSSDSGRWRSPVRLGVLDGRSHEKPNLFFELRGRPDHDVTRDANVEVLGGRLQAPHVIGAHPIEHDPHSRLRPV